MPRELSPELIAPFRAALDQHPVYSAVDSLERLGRFMQHHIYSVWDFMSLIKYLQATVAPTTWPWMPTPDTAVRRFINELVLEEESDQLPDGSFSSHLELYQQAMLEVGADIQPFNNFLQCVRQQGIHTALALPEVPAPSRAFSSQTFAFIDSQQAHQVAAALALGREHIIPGMFRAILARTGVAPSAAPMFHFYLNRHVELDADFHAPLSLRLLNSLCAGDARRIDEAVYAAEQAVNARLRFWDGVLDAITSDHP